MSGLAQPVVRVAFVGLGAMGEPMAANLLKRGTSVTAVAHRRRDALERLEQLGARAASTPQDAGRDADIAVLMLPASSDVESVIFGPSGLASGMREGGLVIDCGTSDPECTRDVAARLHSQGIAMVDAPVSRGVAGARDASLCYFIGGCPEDIERARPVLAQMGNELHVMGSVGSGHAAKLLNNLVSLSTVVLVSEALALGRAAGLDDRTLLAALGAGSASSSILASHGARIAEGQHQPGFTIDLARKDLALAMALASHRMVPSWVGAAAHQAYVAAAARGRGALDVAAVNELPPAIPR
ncbi:MAG: NAD(P)-dependent oxidoreductase [Usitatibacter sp.]